MAEDQKLFSSRLISDVQGGYFCFWTLLDPLLPNLQEQPDPFSAFSLAKNNVPDWVFFDTSLTA